MFTSTITIEGRLAQAPQVFDNLTELVVLTNRRTPSNPRPLSPGRKPGSRDPQERVVFRCSAARRCGGVPP